MFCDKWGPRAEEDIITRWSSRELKPNSPVETHFLTELSGQRLRGHTKKSGDFAVLKLSQVCLDCNTGWMSGLERTTQPILEALIRGERIALTHGERRQIAAWGQLKCLTLDAYYRDVPGSF